MIGRRSPRFHGRRDERQHRAIMAAIAARGGSVRLPKQRTAQGYVWKSQNAYSQQAAAFHHSQQLSRQATLLLRQHDRNDGRARQWAARGLVVAGLIAGGAVGAAAWRSPALRLRVLQRLGRFRPMKGVAAIAKDAESSARLAGDQVGHTVARRAAQVATSAIQRGERLLIGGAIPEHVPVRSMRPILRDEKLIGELADGRSVAKWLAAEGRAGGTRGLRGTGGEGYMHGLGERADEVWKGTAARVLRPLGVRGINVRHTEQFGAGRELRRAAFETSAAKEGTRLARRGSDLETVMLPPPQPWRGPSAIRRYYLEGESKPLIAFRVPANSPLAKRRVRAPLVKPGLGGWRTENYRRQLYGHRLVKAPSRVRPVPLPKR